MVDWSLSTTNKSLFLLRLRRAVVNVGFLYLSNHPIPTDIVDKVIEITPTFFMLPQEAKDAIDMANSAQFLGYERVGHETVGRDGNRHSSERFMFGGDRVCRYEDGQPEYLKFHGDTPWPDDALLPGFRKTMLEYYVHVEKFSYEFMSLVSEALGLGPHELDALFDADRSKLQPRGKLLCYPPADPGAEGVQSGIEAHTDKSVLTYLLQASDQPGLQVQSLTGDWVPVPPIKGTFVINLGDVLEKVTQRIAISTVHRVLSPPKKIRYSVAFFASHAMHVRIADLKFKFPQEVLEMKRVRDKHTG
ncbi:Clavaminate synthase-like protein, partial [Mycena rebaudengoi]